MSRRFLYFAVIGLLVAAVILGLPPMLERVVDTRLSERIDARGVEVSWTSLSWRLPATLELDGVTFSVADDRIVGRAETMQVALPWDVAIADAPRVDEIAIHSAELTVDLRRAEAHPTDTTAPDTGSGGNILEKLRRIGALRGTNITVNVVRHDSPLATLTVEDFAVSDFADTGKSEIAESGRSLQATGEVAISHPRLSRLPLAPIRWSASGTMSATRPELELTIGAERPERPLVEFALPGMGRLSAHRATLWASLAPEAGVAVSLHDLDARLGSAKEPAVELVVPELGVSKTRGHNPRLVVTRPLLGVSPSRLARLRSLLSGTSSQKETPSNSASASQPGLVSRLSWWLARLDASVTQGRFDLRLDREGEASREITLVDGLDASLASGELWARGASAGGQVSLGARLEPGMLLPRTLSIHASDVRLDDLPGIKEGRTLPNRGIRGRLGGVVDLQMMLVTEGEPLAGWRSTGSETTGPGPNAGVTVATALEWKQGHFELSGLADEPLAGIDAGLEFELEWIPALGKLTLRKGRATYGPIGVDLDAELVDWPYDPVFDLEARMERISCQEAAHALPKAFLGAYAGVEIDGEAAPTLRFHLPWHQPRKLRLELEEFVDKCHVTSLQAAKSAWPAVMFAKKESSAPSPNKSVPNESVPNESVPDLLGLNTGQETEATESAPESPAWPTPEKLRGLTYELPEPPDDSHPKRLDDVLWLNRPFKKQVTEGVSEDAEVFVGPGTDAYVPMDELPPFVAGAAYLSEEMEFYENHGVDLGLIQKALRIDFDGERFVYGGSTVTQQLVKNLFLSRDKTLARKLKEALIAWRIEDAVPKWRVLELYLNCIEYAQDVYGIGPAAEHYFGKDARDLSPKEAIFIAILKPAPWYGDRFRRRGHTPTKHWWFNRMGEIMGRLVDKGYLTPEQAEAEKPYVLYWNEDGSYMANPPEEVASPEPVQP